MMNSNIGEIIITSDIAYQVDDIKSRHKNYRVFFESNLKMEHAREIINECCVYSSDVKYIIVAADNFNVQPQNALLKIIEEPPKNIKFIFIAKSKNSLLPTILSRMVIVNKRINTEIPAFSLDITKLSLDSITRYIKDIDHLSKKEAICIIESLLVSVYEKKLSLDKFELDYFSDAIKEIEFGGVPRYIILMLLLMLLQHNRRNIQLIHGNNL